jgi:hypothetical protein
MKVGWIAVAVVPCLIASPIRAEEQLVLGPSTPWDLEYEADSCTLRRVFGEGERQTQLEMRRFEPGTDLHTAIASKAKMTRRAIRYRFGNQGEWRELPHPLFAEFGDKLEGVIFRHSLHTTGAGESPGSGERTEFDFENAMALEAGTAAQLDMLTLSGAFEDDLVLRTGPLKAPLAALNLCTDDLLASWGFDVEAHKTRTRSAGPVNLEGRLLVNPPTTWMGQWGPSRVRLTIDESGLVTECHINLPLTIEMPRSDGDFEKRSCARIRTAFDFEPALDKDGRPMKSYYVTSVGPVIRTREVRVTTGRPTD